MTAPGSQVTRQLTAAILRSIASETTWNGMVRLKMSSITSGSTDCLAWSILDACLSSPLARERMNALGKISA